MIAKILTLTLPAGALAGAVIYAQKQAEKGGKVKPVFESSKIGTPTPWPDDKESPTAIKKKPATNADEKLPPQQEPEKKPETTEKDKEKEKKIMPSSKSMVPGPPVKKRPPPPT